VIATRIGGETRFRSLQIGVSQESFGESIQRNLSWSGRDRGPAAGNDSAQAVRPHFSEARDEGWVKRKRSILDAVREDATSLKSGAGEAGSGRASRIIWRPFETWSARFPTLPPEYAKVEEPETGGDMKDWPRIAKLQTDLLVHALATGQTRVASYMLHQVPGAIAIFPGSVITAARHHDYNAPRWKSPGGGHAGRPAHHAGHQTAGTWKSSPI